MIRFTIPIKTVSPNRVRGNTRLAAIIASARKKKERQTAKLCAMAGAPYYVRLIVHKEGESLRRDTITLTRVSAGTLDTDNLQSSLKACRDGVAEALGWNDDAAGPLWVYAQKKCKRGEYAVEVEIA